VIQKVMIVDNDADTLSVIVELFRYEGYETIAATGSENMLQLIKFHQPALLLIDFRLDNLSGGEICDRVKSEADTAHIRVVIMSAYHESTISWKNLKGDAFVAKPFDLHDLTVCVRQLIGPAEVKKIEN
jgi:two-component system phosphate regulon response regulator PhoB